VPRNLDLRKRNAVRAYVIEVVADDEVWTGMATEYGRILWELKAAPQPAAVITIFEWELYAPANPQTLFSRFPRWRLVATYPWTLDEAEDGD
jgi:hypothetical protein